MTNGIFKSLNLGLSHARAQNVMSTQSTIGFEWSVKLIGSGTGSYFYVGITSMIKPQRDPMIKSPISSYDPNSVLYSTFKRDICVGSKKLHSNLTEYKDGDLIRFRFQPETKKLLIDLVRLITYFSAANL